MCSQVPLQYFKFVLAEFIESHRKFFLLRKRTVPLRHPPPLLDGERKSFAFDRKNEGDWASFRGGIAFGLMEDGFEELPDLPSTLSPSLVPPGDRGSLFSETSIRVIPVHEDADQLDGHRHETEDSAYGTRGTGQCELQQPE